VDEAQPNNSDETHYKVALMQADGLNQLFGGSAGRGDPGDPYPGTSHNNAFTPATNPTSRSYQGIDTGVAVTNISVSGGNVTMDIGIQEQKFFPVYSQG
jgi:immune inhibitor A